MRGSCDEYCPINGEGGSCGLPVKSDFEAMGRRKLVWMCHSNPNNPCVATGFNTVPKGWQAIESLDEVYAYSEDEINEAR
jgi:hypothetical protein